MFLEMLDKLGFLIDLGSMGKVLKPILFSPKIKLTTQHLQASIVLDWFSIILI